MPTHAAEGKARNAEEGGVEGADKEGADKEGAGKEGADKKGADKKGADKKGADKKGAAKEEADKAEADKNGSGLGMALAGRSRLTVGNWGGRRGVWDNPRHSWHSPVDS
ncbi:hypothetical protein [Achromobacter sp. LC458]|uniref:hypothetical protein n=1 Tax=Achromobacter sp. LC458 TaxID=1120623 RepID=UPI000B2C878F|nr:hypothetical protein [Achromobacter sp. LC458]